MPEPFKPSIRQERIVAKVHREVTIPTELREFFQYVTALIKAGDAQTLLRSDDLIQNECAYGGLMKEGGDCYSFAYFPGEETRPKWEMELTRAQIYQIAEGSLQQLFFWGCIDPNCGNLFFRPNETCICCDYIDDTRDARESVIEQISDSPNRREWVLAYLRHFPNAHWFDIIGAYNSRSALGRKWGFFTSEEVEGIIAEAKSSG